jgi:thiosulfate dehydrogenase [quinone] large subunit
VAKKSEAIVNESAWYALAATRILIGFIFLWAYFDKLFGLGFATKSAKAWVNGGSPTMGFLKGVDGPFASMFHTLAGQGWVDALFMIGLLGIGLSLVLGVAVRLGATAGSLLLLMMWMASLPMTSNPLIDEHIIYIAAIVTVCFGLNQQKWSLAGWWRQLAFVKSNS